MYEDYNFTREDREAAMAFSSMYSEMINYIFLYENGYQHILSWLEIKKIPLKEFLDIKKCSFYTSSNLESQFTGFVLRNTKECCKKISCFNNGIVCDDAKQKFYEFNIKMYPKVPVCQYGCSLTEEGFSYDLYWDKRKEKCLFSNSHFKKMCLEPAYIKEFTDGKKLKKKVPSLIWKQDEDTFSYSQDYCKRYRMDYDLKKEICDETILKKASYYFAGKQLQEEIDFLNKTPEIDPINPVVDTESELKWKNDVNLIFSSLYLDEMFGEAGKIVYQVLEDVPSRFKRDIQVEKNIKTAVDYVNSDFIVQLAIDTIGAETSKAALKKILKDSLKNIDVMVKNCKMFKGIKIGKKSGFSIIQKSSLVQTIVDDYKYSLISKLRGPLKISKMALKGLNLTLTFLSFVDMGLALWDRQEFDAYLSPEILKQIESHTKSELFRSLCIPLDREDLLEIEIVNIFSLLIANLSEADQIKRISCFSGSIAMLQEVYLLSLDKNSRGEPIEKINRKIMHKNVNFLKYILKEDLLKKKEVYLPILFFSFVILSFFILIKVIFNYYFFL